MIPPFDESKRCTNCDQTKPLSEFFRRPNRRDGRDSHCKTCSMARHAAYMAKRKEATKARKEAELATRRAMSPLRECRRCGQTKTAADFASDKSREDGLYPWCRPCAVEYQRSARLRDPEEAKRRQRANYAKRMANKVLREKYHLKARMYQFKLRYGITPEHFLEMLEEQAGRCAICGKEPEPDENGNTRSLHVDHNHRTGTVRRPLCDNCNVGLGRFADDPWLLEVAAAYLRSFGH